MKRSEFLRLSLLALVGSSLKLSPQPKLIPNEDRVKLVYFKVSTEMLADKVAFESLYNYVTKDCRGILISSKIGYEGDDFLKNIYTVVLKYKL